MITVRGVLFNAVEILCCLLPKGRPRLFWVGSNSKVFCLYLDTDQVAFVLQVKAALSVKFEHIVDRDGDLFPEILLALAQTDCWRHGGLIELPYSDVL